jgi:hypothetical protein
VADKNHDSKPQSERGLEVAKMHLDLFKHITTFCSGAILLTATVTTTLFPAELARLWLLSLSFIFFIAGLTHALGGLWATIRSLDSFMQTSVSTHVTLNLALSLLASYLGVLSFAFFAAGNLGAV